MQGRVKRAEKMVLCFDCLKFDRDIGTSVILSEIGDYPRLSLCDDRGFYVLEGQKMTFHLIGIGLGKKSISLEALEVLKKCKRVYLENYTIEFPYKIEELEESYKINISPLTRTMVESESFLEEAKNKEVALLVYGAPLIATTHISLLLKCKSEGIKYRIIENASILDALGETGLQVYKFGKKTSMPRWTEHYKPSSFVDVIKGNQKIDAHTVILVDIGLNFGDALKQLEESCHNKIKLDKIIVCSKLGTDSGKVYYDSLEELAGREIYAPFCFIIPGKMHFIEEEFLESL